jgi:nucleotide-binding universal stress UspA family protein
MTGTEEARTVRPEGPGAFAPSRVAVGLDESDNAHRALLWAADEAARRTARLTIVHAAEVPPPLSGPLAPLDHAAPRRARARALLARAATEVRGAHPELAVDTLFSPSPPAYGLTALSQECALMVVGTRGHGGFTGMLTGSVSQKLARHSLCPLVVVRDASPVTHDAVVLGLGPKPAPAAIRHGFEAARRYAAELTVVRAWWPVPANSGIGAPSNTEIDEHRASRAAVLAEVEQALATAVEEFADVKLRIEVVEGNSVAALIDAATGTRLLVVGAHRRRGPLSAGAGYVVDGLLAHSPVPLAIVPVE